MQPFLSAAPKITLTKAFADPFRNVIATARTCYSSKGIIDDASIDLEKYAPLARSIYDAGHHTTFQHAQFQFAMENVSRQFLWSFLHAHPFYNSEQVSQRYVEVKPDATAVPPLAGEALAIYERTVRMQHEAYRELITLLTPATEAAYFARFPFRKKYGAKYAKDIKKKAQEFARYVLPVATFAYLYHTVSGLTLLRYWRAAQQFDTPHETMLVVGAMVEQLLAHDPAYRAVLEEPVPIESTAEYAILARLNAGATSTAFIDEFDRSIEGRTSRLIDYSMHAERTVASAVREVLGVPRDAMSDADAIAAALDPSVNPTFGEKLVLTTHDKLTRALFHAHYTFRKKISHAGDSQDQRHRMTPASRPILHRHIGDAPDVITPPIVAQDAQARAKYDETMARTWDAIGALRRLGVRDEYALYLLPNAVAVRYTESADLLNLQHKHAMRLCYNAQEEIWRASLDEALQINEVHPLIGKYLLPPCTLRIMAGVKPICPEGDRYCGEKVWLLEPKEYSRLI